MSNQTLAVRKIESDADMDAFLHFHWACYKDEPNWVPPLWAEHKAFFDREKNIELHHIDIDYFGAWRGEQLVGIICAHINHLHDETYDEKMGFFGSFEVLNDREAAQALIDAAQTWCRDKGASAIRGPATFSTNSEIGLLVDGFDTPPMIMMTHAHPYYQGFIEGAGFEKEMDLIAYFIDIRQFGDKKSQHPPEKMARVVNKIRKRRNFTVRKVDMRNFDSEVEIVKKIYNSAWEKNWGFVPITEPEVDKLAAELKQIIDPDMTIVVEVEGEPVAFAIPLPNVYEPLKLANARPGEGIFALLRLVWHWKIMRRIKTLRVWGLGILNEYRGTGIDALLYYEMLIASLRKGYTGAEMSWVLENNENMIRPILAFGTKEYKRYRVYQKTL